MGTGIWVVGGFQTDFARNITREGGDLATLTAEVVDGTLTAAGLGGEDVDVIHVGNAFGQLFTGQGHLGAMPATVRDDLWGTPAARHEAACASGSIATLAAVAELTAGFHDCALVLGIEIERNVGGDQAGLNLGAAAWVGHEAEGVTHIWPSMFSRIAEEYDARHGLDPAHLQAISTINLDNARRNPLAQTRSWDIPDLSDDAANPVVVGRMRRYDCSQVTDGAAGILLVNDDFLRRHPQVRPWARLEGWGHRTVGLPLEAKLARSAEDEHVMPHVRQAVLAAFDRAGTTLDGVDGLETHDCFTSSEYLAIDHVGLTPPGQSWRAIEDGTIAADGSFPINPSGGLIGGGHPVGATGVRMLLDASRQVAGTAGENQVEGAQRFMTLNIGGSTATTVSFVVGAAPTA